MRPAAVSRLAVMNFFSPSLALARVHTRSDYLFKLLLIGDSGVGKSCLLLRFAVRLLLEVFWLLSLDFQRNSAR